MTPRRRWNYLLKRNGAWARVHAGKKIGPRLVDAQFLHEAALQNAGPQQRNHAVREGGPPCRPLRGARRKGLRVAPVFLTGFDALCWGIIGQQINVKFASALRRDVVRLAGEKIGDMRAHPSPARVADLSIAQLNSLRFSRSKAS